MSDILSGKTMLVTGGTGSFGTKFTEIALQEHSPHTMRIYSRDELKQLHMAQRFTDKCMRFFLGDVRDKDRLHRAMNGVHIVIHAAALKQVPAAEYNPLEAVKTNIMGAVNVIDTAIENGVEKVILISTDKAVYPVNLYGATKLVAEKLFTQANAYTGGRRTCFSCARYGNVMGSRGSVIPLFLEQRKNGYVRLTDERMTRFWITLEQGVRFVIDCIARMKGGEIFVLKTPSMRLIDLARTVAPEARQEFIGIRPGEKVHEELITQEEAPRTVECDSFYVIKPQYLFQSSSEVKGGVPVPPDFHYGSETNQSWLAPEDLKRYISGLQLER